MLALASLVASAVWSTCSRIQPLGLGTAAYSMPLLWLWMCFSSLQCWGQEAKAQKSVESKSSANRVLAYFANAADYQNAGAFELAAEEWEKLVAEFPKESQASTAWHHLGICSLRRKEPDYQRAVESFRQALKDPKLELREESLINLAWALLSQARTRQGKSETQKQELAEARSRLVEFLKGYSDGAYTDQAIFYLGEIEHLLGNHRRAIEQYKNFLDNRNLAKSSLRPDALYALAVTYQEQQQSAEAQRRFEEFVSEYEQHPLAGEVRLRWSEVLTGAGKPSEAYRILSQIGDSAEPKVFDLSLSRRGALALHMGKLDAAAQHYRRLLDKDTVDTTLVADAALGLSIAWMRQEKSAEAAEMLEATIVKVQDPERQRALQLALAEAWLAQPQRASQARQLFERIATEAPDCPSAPRAAYNAAFSALESGEILVAQQWAERFLARYPSDPRRADVAFIAAEALLRQGLHSGAAQAFQKLIQADSQNQDVSLWKLRLGMALYLDGQYPQALQNMQELIGQLKDRSHKAEAHFISGASHLFQEQLRPAIQEYEASYASDPTWSKSDEALMMLGEAYQRHGQNNLAKSTYRRLLDEQPGSRLKAQVQYKIAQLTAAEGDLRSALSQYQTITQDPEASSFHHFSMYGAAWCLMQQGEFHQAYAELQPLLGKKLPDSIGSEAMLAEGVCLRNMGQLPKAVQALQRFLDRKPTGVSLANGLYELALALASQKEVEQANAALEKILAEVPEYPSTDKVLYELAWNLQDQDQPAAANDKFRQLSQNYAGSPLAAEACYMVAQHDYESGDYQKAIEGYRKIVAQSDDLELLEKSYYKLGWSLFQTEQYTQAAEVLDQQVSKFPGGLLIVDGLFMRAECDFKQDRFEQALTGFQRAREALESSAKPENVSPQVKTLIYLHGGQCLQELKRWKESSEWLKVIIEKHAGSPYLPAAIYELGYSKQNQGKTDEAITHYSEVASNYRNEIAARARFMLGEIYFSQKDFVKAIPEFQRVMYGFGGDKAPEEIKKWQAKSAFEAARCSEALLQSLNGSARKKIVETTIEFYEFLLEKHSTEVELSAQAQSRLGELQKLR
jgi:TolA-binding protein